MAMKLIDETKEVACRTAEANAIRAKTGGTASIPYDFQNEKGFSEAIAAIPSGGTLPAYKVTETGHVFWQDMDLADVTGVFQFSDAHDNPNFHSVCFGGMPYITDAAFRYLPNFERAEFLLKSGGNLTNPAGTDYRVFRDIRSLKTVILGSVGHPVTSFGGLYRFFSGCTQNDLTITIYVNAASVSGIDPAVNALAPWGAANATIIYRSSVTGEVLE